MELKDSLRLLSLLLNTVIESDTKNTLAAVISARMPDGAFAPA